MKLSQAVPSQNLATKEIAMIILLIVDYDLVDYVQYNYNKTKGWYLTEPCYCVPQDHENDNV